MPPQITPVGWSCSEKLRRRAEKKLPKLLDILYRKVQKFERIPGIETEDLLQEAKLAAVYAIATWEPTKGKKLRGYVDLVVRHALLAVVNYDKALKRCPRELVRGRSRKEKRRLATFVSDDEARELTGGALLKLSRERQEESNLVAGILEQLDPEDRRILVTKMNPPPELVVAARNKRPNHPRITDRLVAEYLGISILRVRNALGAARAAWVRVSNDP